MKILITCIMKHKEKYKESGLGNLLKLEFSPVFAGFCYKNGPLILNHVINISGNVIFIFMYDAVKISCENNQSKVIHNFQFVA